MTLSIDRKIILNNGVEIPALGLGVFSSPEGNVAINAVLHAFEVGYRHIDTAKFYGNERSVGIAIRKSNIPRSDIFITTKVWNSDHGYDPTINACNESLEKLGLVYIDLYLIHWPVEKLRLETWKAMETLLVEEKCKAIGVSNYMVHHLEELLANCMVIPAINQIELHPYNYPGRSKIVEFCREHGIQLEAYSPLTKGHMLNDPKLVKIAVQYNKTPAQILIRWALQHDFVVIPKSSNKDRISENADIFDFSISKKDMEYLDSFNENLVTSWDPTDKP